MNLRQEQKQEAIYRMKALHLMAEVIDDFKKNDTIYYSERQNSFFNATLYWVSNNEDYVSIIKDFEKEHNALVYHCQLTHTEFGDMLSILFVSDIKSEWAADRQDIANGEVLVHVINFNSPDYSEFGYIGIKSSMGGITRTW